METGALLPDSTPPAPVWVLRDDRAGHNAQSLGLAHSLGMAYSIKPIEYVGRAKLPNALLGSSLAGLRSHCRKQLAPPWPKLVIAAGRRTIPVVRYIKKHSPDTLLVQLMWPGTIEPFDLIVAPEHDHPPHDPRVMKTLGALHAVTRNALKHQGAELAKQFEHLPRPHLAVLVGGKSKHGPFSLQDLSTLLDMSELVVGGGSLLITTSRRSPSLAEWVCGERLTCPHFVHGWDSGKPNPYPGLLAVADAVVVTGDSISMCTEACFSGKPVFIFNPAQLKSTKHREFQDNLIRRGYAEMLTPDSDLGWKPTAALDEMTRVADAVRKRLKSR